MELSVTVNDDRLVEVEYRDPKRNETARTVGWLREGSYRLLLLSEKIEGIDLYSYTIIPRDFVERITQLR